MKASKFDASFASVPLGDTLKTSNPQTALLSIFTNVMYFQNFIKLTRFFLLIKMDQKIDLLSLEIIFLVLF
jgi:hypothetical protein